MGMVKVFKYFISGASILVLSSCQMAEYRNNERSPHLPFFPDIVKSQSYKSNPYFTRSEIYFEDQRITLSDGKTHFPTSPTINASIGTNYRFANNYYIYAMTKGAGVQYDFFPWQNNSKISLGALAGWDRNWGVSLNYAQEVARIFNGEITPYVSLQRRRSLLLIRCDASSGASCAGDGTLAENRVEIGEDIFNFIIGVQFGRFRLGNEGNTTLNFRVEGGTQNLLSREVIRESYPSNYQNSMSSALLSLYGEITLW